MRRSKILGCVALLALGIAALAWLRSSWTYERERAVSADGEWVAVAYIDGVPLSPENERVHIWRWWQPRFRWLGCQVLEAPNEAPTRLTWQGLNLRVQHGFLPAELLSVRRRCGPVFVTLERSLQPYS